MSVNRALAFILVGFMSIGLGRLSWVPVLAAPSVQEALAIITSPANAAIVRGQVPIMGSATHPAFQFYKVEFAREPVTGGDEVWSIIGAIVEQPVINGQLTVWDTRQVPDGSYSLRLRVVRIDGNYDEAFVRQVVVANAQPERPTETPTPAASPTPTITPTPLPPTPTIVIEQPPRPTERVIPGVTRTPLPTPIPDQVRLNIDPTPFQNACLFGMGAILGLFLLFALLAVLRNLIYALLGRRY
ncbi:MAG: hypothetical protein DDG58_14580 [Ardenticatenia bacterium]|nr:MAG: hypothetical protein DDG58_14580 [Ardenticatenia bacterium]